MFPLSCETLTLLAGAVSESFLQDVAAIDVTAINITNNFFMMFFDCDD